MAEKMTIERVEELEKASADALSAWEADEESDGLRIAAILALSAFGQAVMQYALEAAKETKHDA